VTNGAGKSAAVFTAGETGVEYTRPLIYDVAVQVNYEIGATILSTIIPII
jgi:hypothetical protein